MKKKRHRKLKSLEEKKSQSPFRARIIFLTIIYLILLKIISTFPIYDGWLKRIHQYYTEFKDQRKNLDYATRMTNRQGFNYLLPNYLKKYLKNQPNVVFLLPPQNYLKKTFPYRLWAEPKGFYYFAGKIPTVEINDPNVDDATHTILFNDKKQPLVINITNKDELIRIIQLFQSN